MVYWGCAQQAFGQHTLQRSSIACNGATPPATGGEAQLHAMLFFCKVCWAWEVDCDPDSGPFRRLLKLTRAWGQSCGEGLILGAETGPRTLLPTCTRGCGLKNPKDYRLLGKKKLPKCTPESGFGSKSPRRRSAGSGPPPRRPTPHRRIGLPHSTWAPRVSDTQPFTVRRPRIRVPDGIAFAGSQNRCVAQHQ